VFSRIFHSLCRWINLKKGHMKKLVFFLFFLAVFTSFGQTDWNQKSSLPAPGRYAHISFVVGDEAFCGLGAIEAPQRIYTAGFFRYRPSTDTWDKLADFPGGARYGATAFAINGKGYICLGVDNTHMWRNDVWRFDPATLAWTRMADFPGGNRYGSCSFVIGNKAYLACGSVNDGYGYLRDLWCYTPETDTWVRKADLPVEHKSGAVGFSINGKGYVGCGAANTYETTQDFYQYDPATDHWTRIADLPGKRSGAMGFVLGDMAFVGTGTSLSATYITIWAYSPSTNTWTQVPDPPAGFSKRVSATAFVMNGGAWIMGGRSDPYDPYYNTGVMLNDLWNFGPCLNPIAGYTYREDDLTVSFTDSSFQAAQYHWDFGDGSTTTDKNPVHQFSPGDFNVCLKVTNSCGTDSTCKTLHIACLPPVAGFSSTYDTMVAVFTDTSTFGSLIARLWDFGDSTSSSVKNPVHVYAEPGIYHVCLTITDSCGTSSAYETIYMMIALTLQISAEPAATNDLLANFSDLTPGTAYWKWKFGDGDSSEVKNPSHVYKDYGIYTVCLVAGDDRHLGTTCETLLLHVNPSLHQSNPVILYPNPAREKEYVRFYRDCQSADLFAEDQFGKKVFSRHIDSPDLDAPAEIDLSLLAAGVYFIHVNCDSNWKVWKIVVL